MSRKLKPEKVAAINRRSLHVNETCTEWYCQRPVVVQVGGKHVLTTCERAWVVRKVST